MNILISGAGGHMGRELLALTKTRNGEMTAVSGVDLHTEEALGIPVYGSFEEAAGGPAFDCIIDFSHHSLTAELCRFAQREGKPLVIATTGQTPEEIRIIHETAEKIPVFIAANFSLGVALLIDLAKKTAAMMPEAEIEIIEKHHDRKLDAPSGTALAIAQALKTVRRDAEIVTGRSGQRKRSRTEIGIHAIRMGNIVGEHEVIIGTANQTITLKHEAHSRALFAEGALSAAVFLAGKPAGLYSMQSLLAD